MSNKPRKVRPNPISATRITLDPDALAERIEDQVRGLVERYVEARFAEFRAELVEVVAALERNDEQLNEGLEMNELKTSLCFRTLEQTHRDVLEWIVADVQRSLEGATDEPAHHLHAVPDDTVRRDDGPD